MKKILSIVSALFVMAGAVNAQELAEDIAHYLLVESATEHSRLKVVSREFAFLAVKGECQFLGVFWIDNGYIQQVISRCQAIFTSIGLVNGEVLEVHVVVAC